jgi:hypothetical protein
MVTSIIGAVIFGGLFIMFGYFFLVVVGILAALFGLWVWLESKGPSVEELERKNYSDSLKDYLVHFKK